MACLGCLTEKGGKAANGKAEIEITFFLRKCYALYTILYIYIYIYMRHVQVHDKSPPSPHWHIKRTPHIAQKKAIKR